MNELSDDQSNQNSSSLGMRWEGESCFQMKKSKRADDVENLALKVLFTILILVFREV